VTTKSVGIVIQNNGSTGNQILGNNIGTDPSFEILPLGNSWGIEIRGGAKNNIIGGSTAEIRNFISGNINTGVVIRDVGTTDNKVLGNYIGVVPLDATTSFPVANTWGIVIALGAQNNVIGGDTIGTVTLLVEILALVIM